MLLPVGTLGLLNLATCCYQWEHVAISSASIRGLSQS